MKSIFNYISFGCKCSILIFLYLFLLFGCDKVNKDSDKSHSKNKISNIIVKKNIQKTIGQTATNNISAVSLNVSNVIVGVNKFELLKNLRGKLNNSKPLTDDEIKLLIENTSDVKTLMKEFKWKYDLMTAGDRKFYLRFLELAEPELTIRFGKLGYKEEVACYYMKWPADNENKLTKMAEELEFPEISEYPDEKTFRKELLHYSQILIFAGDRASDPETAAELYIKSSLHKHRTDLFPFVEAAEKYVKAHKKDKARELLEKVINTPEDKLDYVKPIDGKSASILVRWSLKRDNKEAIEKARKLLGKLNKPIKIND